MRLLFVSHSFPPPGLPEANLGGMQRAAVELHDQFSRHPAVELESVILRTSSRWSGIRTVPFLWSAYRNIKRLVERREVDAALFSSMVTGSLAVFLRRAFQTSGVPSLAIAHGDDVIHPTRAYQKLLPKVFNALDAVLPVSRATRGACLERGADESKVIVVPNGINPKRFVLDCKDAGASETDTVAIDGKPPPKDAFLLCSVGRHVRRKGFGWFIAHVMPMLPPEVHYWLIGTGGETHRIRDIVNEKELGDRVRLLGRISDATLAAVYRRADLFVMPNIQVQGTMEGFGLVMLEAGLCRLPTIAARLEGIEDVIIDGRNGRLVESGNPQAFIDAIGHYVHDRDALATLNDGAESTALRCTWESVVAQHLRTIERLL